MLALLCALFPRGGVTVGGVTLRFPSLHKVLVREREVSLDELLREEERRELQGLRDTIAYYRAMVDSSDLRFWFPDDDPAFFDPLFEQMEAAQASGRTIRILHYGDSQIEMDRMTDRIRAYAQREYGGGGPGLVPILQTIPSRSVSQWASGDLAIQSSYGFDSLVSYRANGNYGPMTRCLRLAGTATAGFDATKHRELPPSFARFSDVTMIFNNRPGPLSVTLNAGGRQFESNSSDEGVQAFSWHTDTVVARLRFTLRGTADIYGVMIDDGPGVAVDNIAMRGCSGQQFTMINADQLAAAYRHMDVGLIILQFGGNSVPYIKGDQSLKTYTDNLGRQIDRLHEACPNALILFVGPSDMCASVDGELRTYPFLPTMVEGLRKMANEHGAAYWSIYHAMGGRNSMKVWASNGLAGADYIHFSQKGVDLMGDRFVEALENMRDLYHFRQTVDPVQFDTLWRQ